MRKLFSLPIDWFALLIPLLLLLTGIVTIYTITFAQHHAALALNQLLYAVIGLIFLLIFMFSDYRTIGSVSSTLFIIGLLLLVPLLPMWASHLPFVLKVFGAHRWLTLGIFQVQPAEVFKLIAILFGAKFLSTRIGHVSWRAAALYILLAVVSFGLVLAQPDLGTAGCLLTVFLVMFLAAKPSWKTLAVILALFVIAVPLAWGHLKPYQKSRVSTFLNPASDPEGQGYNVRQALIAVGSGGLIGRGFGQGSQTVLNFLPVPHADFIFAGYAEATGFVGSMILLGLYAFLILRVLAIARESTDPFGQLVAIGIATKLLFQVTVHIGINVGLLPVTGIPLPFMSYGGTAIIVDLAAIGILESIHIRHKKFVFAS